MQKDPIFAVSCHYHLDILRAFDGPGAPRDTTAKAQRKPKLLAGRSGPGVIFGGGRRERDAGRIPHTERAQQEEMTEGDVQIDEPNTPGRWDKNTCRWEQVPVEVMELSLRAVAPRSLQLRC